MGSTTWHFTPICRLEKQRIEIESDFIHSIYGDIQFQMNHPSTLVMDTPGPQKQVMMVPTRKNLKVIEKALELPVVRSAMTETAKIVNTALEQVTATVDKIDTLACDGIDKLIVKVPVLKETTPKLIAITKVSPENSCF
jgi:hypothetical protein